jgi:hypothetical protein
MLKPPDDLATNSDHLVIFIGNTWFSYTQKGLGIQFHIKGENPKTVKDDCKEFIDFAFKEFEWCRMLLVTIYGKMSLVRLAKKLGFYVVMSQDDKYFLARQR